MLSGKSCKNRKPIEGINMPKPKILSKTKAANRVARQLGFKSTLDCEQRGTAKQKLLIQEAFTQTNPNGKPHINAYRESCAVSKRITEMYEGEANLFADICNRKTSLKDLEVKYAKYD